MAAIVRQALRAAHAKQDVDATCQAVAVRLSAADLAPAWPLPFGTLYRLATTGRRSPQPAVALRRCLALLPHLPKLRQWRRGGRQVLLACLGGSEAAARYLAADPSMAAELVISPFCSRQKPPSVLRDELRQARARSRCVEDFFARARRYRTAQWIRIVGRAIAKLAACPQTLIEQSELADAVLDACTRVVWRQVRAQAAFLAPRRQAAARHEAQPGFGFVVLAQGKLAARELNVSSDVDVQYLYTAPAAQRDAMASVCTQVATRLTQALSRRDEHGFCYRVDLDLRPEGKRGPLVNSLSGAEHYYEAFGHAWERLALARARPVAGARWVGRAFCLALRPFVYPRSISDTLIDEIAALKRRIHAERRFTQLGGNIDLKRDLGGIREVELFVQILQYLYGGHCPAVRTPSLLGGLQKLQLFGLITRRQHDHLRDAYLFLRSLENAVQLVDERQTHQMPSDPQALQHLACLVGLGTSARLQRRLQRVRRRVQALTGPLFALHAGATKTTRLSRAAEALLQSGPPQQAALAKLGFAAAGEAQSILQTLREAPRSPFYAGAKEADRPLCAPLLRDITTSADPDQALRLYAALDPILAKQPMYLRLLLEKPFMRRRLVDLLGSSEYLARAMFDYPELLDWLAASDSLTKRRKLPDVLAEVAARQRGLGDVELQLRSLRRLALQEHLRIGMLDLAGTLSTTEVQSQLGVVAEACLRSCLALSEQAVMGRCGLPWCIIGMGRLGGRALGYGSDLDLLFVYEDEQGTLDAPRAIRLAQKLISFITARLQEGSLFTIDTRLRPSGSQGPLVSAAGSFVQYHRAHAMLWERQALLRARCVAGDAALGARVLAALDEVRYPPALADTARADIHAMRLRMAQTAPGANIKLARGGLVDIEFLVQYLQLRHAHALRPLRTVSTLEALGGLLQGRIIAPAKARSLRQAYLFLQTLEARLRMVHNRPSASMDLSQPAAQALARRMGCRPGPQAADQLRRRYLRVVARVSRLYDEIMDPPGPP